MRLISNHTFFQQHLMVRRNWLACGFLPFLLLMYSQTAFAQNTTVTTETSADAKVFVDGEQHESGQLELAPGQNASLLVASKDGVIEEEIQVESGGMTLELQGGYKDVGTYSPDKRLKTIFFASAGATVVFGITALIFEGIIGRKIKKYKTNYNDLRNSGETPDEAISSLEDIKKTINNLQGVNTFFVITCGVALVSTIVSGSLLLRDMKRHKQSTKRVSLNAWYGKGNIGLGLTGSF